ncbi:MAG TPA: ABC transporter substrate-binding protein [Dissulfurispiraceae bacterium]
MNTKKFFRTVLFSFLFFILLSAAAAAQAGSPTEQVKQTVDKVLEILRSPQFKGPEKTAERRAAIHKIADPRFDYEEMAKRSLALYWRQRTPEERKEFVPLYRDLLERAYIRKIEKYTDEKIVYTGENIDGGYATVRTKVIRKEGTEIPIDYKLMNENGQWKVYDVVVEGVSLVNNYRTQFNQIIRSSSYEELVRKLKAKAEFKEPK